MTRLTKRRLHAIVEALSARLAGEIDVQDDIAVTRDDYEAAHAWACEQVAKKQPGKGDQA